MADTFIQPIFNAFENKWRTSTSFQSHTLELIEEVIGNTGLGAASKELHLVSSLAKAPLKAEQLYSAICNGNYLKGGIKAFDLGAKTLSLITAAQKYSAIGENTLSAETIPVLKAAINVPKSALKLIKDFSDYLTAEETIKNSQSSTDALEQLNHAEALKNRKITCYKALNHGIRFASHSYRIATYLTNCKKYEEVLVGAKLIGVILDVWVAYMKGPKERERVEYNVDNKLILAGQVTVNEWKTNTNFMKYASSATSGLLDLAGVMNHTPKSGWVYAAASYHELTKLNKVYTTPKQFASTIRMTIVDSWNDGLVKTWNSGRFKAAALQVCSILKFNCTMLRIANRFHVWLPSQLRFETSEISKWKLRFEFGYLSIQTWDIFQNWRENKTDKVRIAKLVGFGAVTGSIGYLNITQLMGWKRSSNLLLLSSVVGVVGTVAAPYFSISNRYRSC